MKLHPQDLTLQELLESLSPSSQSILQHILICKDCFERIRFLSQSQKAPSDSLSNVVALDRWVSSSKACSASAHQINELQAAFDLERSQAGRLVGELMEQPAERRRLLILNQARFQTWGVCEEVLNRSRELNFSDAARGEALARLGAEIGDLLDGARYGEERVEDLRARAWAYVGNSRRILADLEGAEAAFEQSFHHLRDGTGEPMERAMILDLRASLYRAQRRFDEAFRSLRRAVATFRELGETHRAGRALYNIAVLHQLQGEPEKAIPLIYQTIDLIEPEREPRLVFAAWHGLIDNLADLGRHLEAHKLAVQARPILQQFSEPWAQNPRKWAEAKIARGLGQADHAEGLFIAARKGFLAESAPFEVALVSLELASLYLEQGRNDEARRVTEEALPIFASRGIHPEALAAFLYWKEAVEADRAEAATAAVVGTFLKRSRNDPSLTFQRPQTNLAS